MKSLAHAPTLALLLGAAFWGVVWYPYRILAAAGLDGFWSTLFTYGGALAAGCVIFPRALATLVPLSPAAIVMGLSIGWSNLAYVLAVLQGDVMRVLGLSSGPEVGHVLHRLLEHVLDDPALNTREWLLARLGEMRAAGERP